MTTPPASRYVFDRTYVIQNEADIKVVQTASMRRAVEAGAERKSAWEFAIAVSEAASNIFHHAGRGHIILRCASSPRRYLEFVAIDSGDGISDLDQAMIDGISRGRDITQLDCMHNQRGLGSGLGAIKRLMDDLKVTSESGEGTRVSARKFL